MYGYAWGTSNLCRIGWEVPAQEVRVLTPLGSPVTGGGSPVTGVILEQSGMFAAKAGVAGGAVPTVLKRAGGRRVWLG